MTKLEEYTDVAGYGLVRILVVLICTAAFPFWLIGKLAIFFKGLFQIERF